MSSLALQSTAFWAAVALFVAGATIAIAGLLARRNASAKRSHGQGPYREPSQSSAPLSVPEPRSPRRSLMSLIIGMIGIVGILLICAFAGLLALTEIASHACCSSGSR